MSRLRPAEYSSDNDVRLAAQAFDPSKVADSGGNPLEDSDFSTPFALNATNSVIETSTAVEQIADSSGTLQTDTTDPGGWQVGYGTLTSTGQGAQSRQSTDNLIQKREISSRDIIVILAFATGTNDVTFDVSTIQDW